MEIDLAAIEEPNHGEVEVPPLVGSLRPDADLRLRWIKSGSRTSPASLDDQPPPGRPRCEDQTASLGMEAESSEPHVAKSGVENVVLDPLDLLGSEAGGEAMRLSGSVVELATKATPPPRVEPRLRETHEAQYPRPWQQGLPRDRGEVVRRLPLGRDAQGHFDLLPQFLQ